MFLARKISQPKWEPREDLADGEISADAITADLRTKENKLSLWRCGTGTPEEIDQVVLAMTASYSAVGVCDVALIAEEELTAVGHVLEESDGITEESDGITTVDDLVKQHVDLVRLDYERLGHVARCVSASVAAGEAGGRFRRTKVPRISDLLAAAVEDGRLPLDALHDKVRRKVDKRLAVREAGAAGSPD